MCTPFAHYVLRNPCKLQASREAALYFGLDEGQVRNRRIEIVAANWDSIVFDVGREPLRRVPMMEPLRGTADHVARLIDESDNAVELLDRLGS